jgi:hypothetical protein
VFIEMASALQTARVADDAFEAPLTIERVGAPCAGFWGESPAPLLQLDLSFSDDMRVTVSDVRNACSVLGPDTSVPSRPTAVVLYSSNTQEFTNLSLPLERRADCGPRDWSATQQLRRVDARTLRWQQDARWSIAWYQLGGPLGSFSEGGFRQRVDYVLHFRRAGRVTITLEQTAGSCDMDVLDIRGVFTSTAGVGIGKVSNCWITSPADSTTSISFDVPAGHRQEMNSRFEVFPSEERFTLIREHASTHTIRFEPAQ